MIAPDSVDAQPQRESAAAAASPTPAADPALPSASPSSSAQPDVLGGRVCADAPAVVPLSSPPRSPSQIQSLLVEDLPRAPLHEQQLPLSAPRIPVEMELSHLVPVSPRARMSRRVVDPVQLASLAARGPVAPESPQAIRFHPRPLPLPMPPAEPRILLTRQSQAVHTLRGGAAGATAAAAVPASLGSTPVLLANLQGEFQYRHAMDMTPMTQPKRAAAGTRTQKKRAESAFTAPQDGAVRIKIAASPAMHQGHLLALPPARGRGHRKSRSSSEITMSPDLNAATASPLSAASSPQPQMSPQQQQLALPSARLARARTHSRNHSFDSHMLSPGSARAIGIHAGATSAADLGHASDNAATVLMQRRLASAQRKQMAARGGRSASMQQSAAESDSSTQPAADETSAGAAAATAAAAASLAPSIVLPQLSLPAGVTLTSLSQAELPMNSSLSRTQAQKLAARAARRAGGYATIGAAAPSKQLSEGPSPETARSSCIQLRCVFLLFTLVQVLVCCFLSFYIGYRNSLSTVRTLSAQIRSTQIKLVASAVTNHAESVLLAAERLATRFTVHVPSLAAMGGLMDANPDAALNYSLVSEPGALHMLSAQLAVSSRTPLLSISSINGNVMTVQRQKRGLHRYSLVDPLISRAHGAAISPFNNSFFDFNFARDEWYQANSSRVDPLNNPALNTRASFFQPRADFPPEIKPTEAIAMLGAPVGVVKCFNNTDRPVFYKAQELGVSQLAWTDVFVLVGNLAGKLGMAAVRSVHDTVGDPSSTPPRPASGKLSFVASSFFYLEYIRDSILRPVVQHTGPNGVLFLVEGSGLLVATTLKDFGENEINERTLQPQRTQMVASNHAFVAAMMEALRERDVRLFEPDSDPIDDSVTDAQQRYAVSVEYPGLPDDSPYGVHPLTHGPVQNRSGFGGGTTPLFQSGDLVDWDSMPVRSVSDVHFRVGGVDWHVNARTTTIPGLDWVLIVVTRDSDFDGGLFSTIKVTILATALVALAALLVSLLLANWVSHPLRRLVDFMELVATKLHVTKPGPNEEGGGGAGAAAGSDPVGVSGQHLTSMCREWNATMRSLNGGSRTLSRDSSLVSNSTDGASSDDNSVGTGGFGRRSAGRGAPLHSGRRRRRSQVSQSQISFASKAQPDRTSPVLEQVAQALNKDAGGSGDATANTTPALNVRSIAAADQANSSSVSSRSSTSSAPRSWYARLARRVRRATPRWLHHFPLRETLLLESSFGSMLESLRSNHQSLQTANESKRRFIR